MIYRTICSTTVSLMVFLASTFVSYGQEACKPVDELTAARAMPSIQGASPEALSAVLEVSRNQSLGRIVGGHLTLVNDNPWQIAMIRAQVAEPTRSQFCGGSLIRDNWVLTAAHCVDNAIVRKDPSRVDVIAGTTQYAIGGERLKVSAIHTHPNYNSSTMDNDFALLQLQAPSTMGHAIQLVDAQAELADGTGVCVSGWGAIAEGSGGSLDLLGAVVPIVSNTVCNEPGSYGGDILPSMLCAGRKEGGVDSCQGDSGGPLSASIDGKNTLVGVVSWGEGCARRLKYGVYSRITTATGWIATTMGN
ncbi:MAG: serine protease [Mesorhizobium sp.]|nr:MAG: serine protease [Mesorhizobium sp.]